MSLYKIQARLELTASNVQRIINALTLRETARTFVAYADGIYDNTRGLRQNSDDTWTRAVTLSGNLLALENEAYEKAMTEITGNGSAIQRLIQNSRIGSAVTSAVQNILQDQNWTYTVKEIDFEQPDEPNDLTGLFGRYAGGDLTITVSGRHSSFTDIIPIPEGRQGDKGDTGSKGDKGDKGDKLSLIHI